MKKIILSIIVSIFIISLILGYYHFYQANWSYQLKGRSNHWEGILFIQPYEAAKTKLADKQNIILGELNNLNHISIQELHFEIESYGFGGHAGNISNPVFIQQGLELFKTSANGFLNHIDKQTPMKELRNYLDDVKLTISWKDNGKEYKEAMLLILQED